MLCLCFLKVTDLKKSQICWLDSIREGSSHETQRILIDTVYKQNTSYHSLSDWKGLLNKKISDKVPTIFLKQPPILPTPLFLWKKSEPLPPFWENFENSKPPWTSLPLSPFWENFENSTNPPPFPHHPHSSYLYKGGDSNYEYSGAIPLQIRLIDCFINFTPWICLKMVPST